MPGVPQDSGRNLPMTELLAQVINALQLPLAPHAEEEVHDSIEALGVNLGFSADDFALVLKDELEDWGRTGTPAENLRAAVDAALGHTPEVLDSVDGRSYFAMYTKLRSGAGDIAGLSHPVVRRLLSRASLIAHLLGEERFSCSQIARLLHATEGSLDVSYGSVTFIARELKLLPALNSADVGDKLWEADLSLSLTLFPDSTLEETSQIATEAVETWLPEMDMEELLNRLSKASVPGTEPTWPYLQILHWCLTPIEVYDHPASYLYEFAPRGQIATALFNRYPTVTGNPVLNNAKAVETLNSTWARNRGGDDAHALVAILATLESLPFIPRQQVARVLRAWLTRVIELRTVTPIFLTTVASNQTFEKATKFVAEYETNTQGVIEQRVVDCMASLAFGRPGWRPRGLGDGVNASNLSRHKLGDVEFTNVDERKAIALEAHGGYLSATYVADHSRSLGRVIEQRLAESWAGLDDPSAWEVRVLFVAHSRDSANLPDSDSLHGVAVTYKYIDYFELLDQALADTSEAEQHAAFDTFVIEALNLPIVRESARERFRGILDA
jgi:hypothetical protein